MSGAPGKPKASGRKASPPAKRARKRAGRPGQTKLTPERTTNFAAALRRGESIEAAAELIGVTSRTVRGWITRGAAAPAGAFGEFAREAAAARADQEQRELTEDELVRVMEKAAKDGSLRAAQFLLERKWPERWAPASRTAKPKDKDDEPSDPFEALDALAARRARRAQAA